MEEEEGGGASLLMSARIEPFHSVAFGWGPPLRLAERSLWHTAACLCEMRLRHALHDWLDVNRQLAWREKWGALAVARRAFAAWADGSVASSTLASQALARAQPLASAPRLLLPNRFWNPPTSTVTEAMSHRDSSTIGTRPMRSPSGLARCRIGSAAQARTPERTATYEWPTTPARNPVANATPTTMPPGGTMPIAA